MRLSVWLGLVLGLIWAPAQAGEVAVTAVFELQAPGLRLSEATRDKLTEVLAVRLTERGWACLQPDQIRHALEARKLPASEPCADSDCQRARAKALDVPRFLTVHVLQIGTACQLTARLFTTERLPAIRAATVRGGCKEAELLEAVVQAADKLQAHSAAAASEQETVTMDEASAQRAPDQAGPAGAQGDQGSLSLNSIPWGRVWIDGKDTGLNTPLLHFSLPQGRHRVEVRTSDGARLSSEVEIWAGESFSLILRSDEGALDKGQAGWLAINTEPWSEVFVDQKHVGMTPLRYRLLPGKHLVRLVFAHGETRTQEVQVKPGETTRLVTRAETPSDFPFRPNHGLLKLHSSPWGRVWIDGRDSGKATPVFNQQLTAGVHRVTIHFATGGFMTEEVTIRSGETTRKVIRQQR